MFRLATCNDLIRLKARHAKPGDRHFDPGKGWGLKQMGTLFCYDRIAESLNGRAERARILEVGAGLNTAFDELFADRCEYWMIDRTGFYNAEAFASKAAARRATTHVDGLLGQSEGLLADGYFDMVFSVSVLEHVHMKEIEGVCRDMFRVLKPGGRILHTIDSHAQRPHLREYAAAFARAGFQYDEPVKVEWSIVGGDPTLFEPLEIQFKAYSQKPEPTLWEDPSRIEMLWATALVSARKPA